MITPIISGLIFGGLGFLAFLAGYFHGLSRRQTPDELTVSARVLKIDKNLVSPEKIAELVARCQPVVILYDGTKVKRYGMDMAEAIK